MISFTERVKRNQEKHEGLHVFKVSREIVPLEQEPIDLLCMNKNGKVTFIRARGNGHGNLQEATKFRLKQLGKQCNARILYASVNGENEIVFKILYERK